MRWGCGTWRRPPAWRSRTSRGTQCQAALPPGTRIWARDRDGAAGGERGLDDDGAAPAEAGDTAALEAALDLLAPRWAEVRGDGDLPSSGRLATLRRRFRELGAANPFAVDEYRAVREQLETLDAQDKDLREAIGKTRALIADLDVLIATQFRTTFAALEVAFDARFQQLFGGSSRGSRSPTRPTCRRRASRSSPSRRASVRHASPSSPAASAR